MSRLSSKRLKKKIKEAKPKKMSASKRQKLVNGIENMIKKGVKDKGRNSKSSMTKACGVVFKVKV